MRKLFWIPSLFVVLLLSTSVVHANLDDLDDTIIPARAVCENNWPTYLIIAGMSLLIISRKKQRL